MTKSQVIVTPAHEHCIEEAYQKKLDYDKAHDRPVMAAGIVFVSIFVEVFIFLIFVIFIDKSLFLLITLVLNIIFSPFVFYLTKKFPVLSKRTSKLCKTADVAGVLRAFILFYLYFGNALNYEDLWSKYFGIVISFGLIVIMLLLRFSYHEPKPVKIAVITPLE